MKMKKKKKKMKRERERKKNQSFMCVGVVERSIAHAREILQSFAFPVFHTHVGQEGEVSAGRI